MKLSSRAPVVLRLQRQEGLRRARAAARSLRAAFPSVQELRLDLKFEGPASNAPATQTHELHPPAPAFFEFPCPYADCDGRFDLTRVVESMLGSGGQHCEGLLECFGLRPGQGGSRQACGLRLRYQVRATCQQGVGPVPLHS
ncbi:MAG: hypothetical protein ACRETP_03935 [Steroidobacteraceae bacterium]